jgi:hypothetical protein
MACPQRCVIAEANDHFWLPNGCAVPHHGNRTSAGCPLHSTLNGISGYWSTDEGAVPDRYVPDGLGGWIPCSHAFQYDLVFAVRDAGGRPAADVPYRVTLDTGRSVEGRTDRAGRTSIVHSNQPEHATIIVPFYGNIQTTTDANVEPDACDC